MEPVTLIPKQQSLTPDQDFYHLRSEGLKYIESLGSDIWTDYNVHDPGITILEALCYAITELGYRTAFPVKDLLAEEDGKISKGQTFYTARNILTSNPVTINDYRKLLVDIAGVHNAWLYADNFLDTGTAGKKPVNEVPLFADCKADALTVARTDHPLYLSGLYRVLLDLDNDGQFGDLNKGDVELFNPASTGATPRFKAGAISFTMELPFWNEVDGELVTAASSEATIDVISVFQENGKWKAKLTTTNGLSLTFIVTINLKPKSLQIEQADMSDFFTKKYMAQVFTNYSLKINKIKSILLQVKKVLHASRNLCEDFIKIETVKDEEVAICCDIDVRPDADMEKVQAQVFFLIENYLNPSVNFYLLKELLAKGCSVDQVFTGPKLDHGFIDTEELERTNLRETIYTSDIINLLMDIPGVLSVRNFMLTKYDQNGNAIKSQTGLKWCMKIAKEHKPVLSINRSKIIFFKNNFPFIATYAEIRDTLKLLRAGKERPKLKGQQDDLPVPTGNYHILSDYYSIQQDLPQTYGVGNAGVGFTATPLRKAQAKQLKAYLLFYDQLLADFFSQLSNAKELFSLNNSKQTYYAQYLDTIPDIQEIYKEASGSILLKDLFANQDSTGPSANKEWKRLVENEQTFEKRRNLFLDHLLGRFAESFNEYVLMMYSVNAKDRTAQAINAEKLINNKIEFLREYPVISYERGKAFNYLPLKDDNSIDEAMLWDTDNVSGLEKRSAKLAGIKNYYRRFLSCIQNIEIQTISEKVIDNGIELVKTTYQFSLKNKNGDLLIQKNVFESREELEKIIAQLPSLLNDKANYLYDAASRKIEVINSDSKVVAISAVDYPAKADADKIIKQFEKEFNEDCEDAEGMLLIEHILLRPREKEYALMNVCLDKECEFCGEEDPYSFRASVFLPYWPEPFDNTYFRTYFEQMIRSEAPAHIMLKVCWINNTQMRELEIIYQQWITALAAYTRNNGDNNNKAAFKKWNDALVSYLPTLHTVYPEATLHDCDESVNTNPVMLGKTILGTLKHRHND